MFRFQCASGRLGNDNKKGDVSSEDDEKKMKPLSWR